MANWKKVIVSGSAAELASLSLDTALTVANGGTGASTLTDHGVLLGSGTGAVTALGVATNGQLVIGSTGADPSLATLTQGTGVTITNTAGGIEIAATGTGGTVTSVGGTGTVNGLTLTGVVTTSGSITLGGTLSGIANGALTNSTVSYGGIQLSLGGSDATPAFNLSDATSLPLGTGTTGTLATTRGGTGLTSYTTGDIIYSSAGNTLAKLGIGTAGQVLTLAAGVPSWATPATGDLTSIALATNGGLVGTSLTGPIPQLSASIAAFAAGTIAVANDSFAFLDATDGLTKKESISDFIGLVAGTGLTATSGQLSANDQTSSLYTNITGDVLITAAGVSSVNSVQANSVALGTDTTGDYVANLGTGTGVTIASNTGEGSQPTISVNYGSSANQSAQGNTAVTFLGTANEVELSTNTFTTVGGGGAVTIGLPNDVTITNNLTVSNNAVISGDLTVSGTASFTHSENLDIADKFITLASGSTPGGSGPSDGGFVVAQDAVGSIQVGEALGLNISAAGNGRWGITGSFSNNAGAIVPLDYMVTTRASATAPSAVPVYGGSTDGYGNMHVDTNLGDIYIYA
jgi:hypothetical protein